MSINTSGPSRSESPLPEKATDLDIPADVKKTGEVASKELGVVGQDSRMQANTKSMLPTEKSTHFGDAIRKFAESVIQKFTHIKGHITSESKQIENEKKLQNVLNTFKIVDTRISDFEKNPPPNLNDSDAIMIHQQHVADIRDQLEQLRSKADAFKDPEVKEAIANVLDTLMGRLNELLTEKFDAAKFFTVPVPLKKTMDEDLIDLFPEGEMPDPIPSAAREDVFAELDQDLEELSKSSDWSDWDYTEPENK